MTDSEIELDAEMKGPFAAYLPAIVFPTFDI